MKYLKTILLLFMLVVLVGVPIYLGNAVGEKIFGSEYCYKKIGEKSYQKRLRSECDSCINYEDLPKVDSLFIIENLWGAL